MPDCLSAPYLGPYDCIKRWGLNCTNDLGFDFTTLQNITLLIQQYCPTDPRLFRTDNLPATPENAALTLDACKTFAPESWTLYPTSDIWARLQTWKFPLFQLVASSPRPPLGLAAETFVLAHLMGDPIGSMKDLLGKLRRCEERANYFARQQGCIDNETERVWKSLALIVVSYDEWGEEKGDQAAEALSTMLNKLQGIELDKFLELCYNASESLAADRATAFLPIITAQSFFVGALAVAVFKTATITAASSISVNVEAHSIAFSALYFWIIPAVFLASVIGVSQTEKNIPRILKDFKNACGHESFLKGLGEALPVLSGGNERLVSGGIYSWPPVSQDQSEDRGLWARIWQVVKDKENYLPIFTVTSGTITAMLISGYVPADGWQPRHCAYASFLTLWFFSFLMTTLLKTPRNSLFGSPASYA